MARSQLTELEKRVAEMRRLGVISWDGIVLGPEPLPKTELKATKASAQAKRRQYYEEVLGRSVSKEELERLP